MNYPNAIIYGMAGVPKKFWGVRLDSLLPVNKEQRQYREKLYRLERGEIWSLTVLGTVGNGKSLFSTGLIGLHNAIKPYSALYVTQGMLMDMLKATFNGEGSEMAVISRFCSCDVLVFDELSLDGWTDYTKSSVQRILLSRHGNGLKTVLIGNLDDTTFKGMLDAHIVSRLREGATQMMLADDMRTNGDF